MRTNTRAKAVASAPRTHEGAQSRALAPAAELRRTVMASLLFEGTFYESGVDAAQRVRALAAVVPFEDAAAIAVEARTKFKLRHVPLLVVRELLRHHTGRRVGDLVNEVIQRPDELGELLSLYWADGKDQPLTAQLKIGLARALGKFSEYQLAKWDTGGAAVKLRDVLFLTHPRPRYADDPGAAPALAPAIDKKGYRRGQVWRHGTSLLARVAAGTLATPDTWEVGLSGGADKRETFTRLLSENKLGALALLRNLRNMVEAGVDEDLVRAGLARMSAARVLPFRFVTAAKYAPRLEDAIEAAMLRCLEGAPRLPGRTALLVDHSHSMDAQVSAKSEVTRFQAAAALAMILRETAERCRVFTFSTACVEVAPRRGFGMLAELNRVRRPEHTWLGKAVEHVYSVYPECDRIIVVSDEQSADRPPHPRGTGYVINVAGYQHGIAYGPWVAIDGWSEAVLDYVRAYEGLGAEAAPEDGP